MIKAVKELEFLIGQNPNNLADIPDDEDLIIKYLMHRYEQGKVYTWVGPVLLAINPRHSRSDLYDQTQHNNFTRFSKASQYYSTIEPHVFAVAEAARYRLAHGLGKVNQVIVISGDSGSGKTFSASKILHFLAATNPSYSSIDRASGSTLSQIEKACLVISAFSTASTQQNAHSSRHGQLIQLQYSNSSIQGAVINSFLLEQTRVTSGCDNFHIFGQMLAGLSDSELETLKLSRSTFYKISNGSDAVTQKSRITGFQSTVEAMGSLGLGQEQRTDIFKVIALLIHLGNIQFKEQATAGCDVDVHAKDSAEALEAACDLMALPTSDLVQLLTTSLIRPWSKSRRHSIYHSAIATAEACNARLHSVIRYLYHRLFRWLVNRFNDILTCREAGPRLLGILDIFGFEFFSANGIEQLSINYANERMQNHFMKNYLEAGRSELESEGLSVLPLPSTFGIYEQRLAAIEGGLFAVFNDACLVARIEEPVCLNQLVISAREGNERFLRNRGGNFEVFHYSCTLEYRTEDILRKNTDKVPTELQSTFSLCQNGFILSLLDSEEEGDVIQQQNRSRVDKKKNTTLAKLKHSMDALIKELDKYDQHYIRCMKPVDCVNDPGIVKEFKEQLACSGILDVLPLARCAFPIRLKYDEFSKRYSNNERTAIDRDIGDLMQQCKRILQQVLNGEELLSLVHFGSRLIFLADVVLYKLELMRDKFRSQCASKIQAFWHKYKLKKQPKVHESLARTVDPEDIKDGQVLSLDTNKKGFSRTTQDSEDYSRLSNFLADLKDRAFFYRNRILSRQRIAEVPVRFHTRLTCLPDSHRLPRSELPNGLKDCL